MRNHLYMLGTRGTAFWEYYYSYSMFDDNKWQINAEAAKWIEDNFDILQKSQMFGGKPNDGNVYGYSCWNGKEGILSIRNPKNAAIAVPTSSAIIKSTIWLPITPSSILVQKALEKAPTHMKPA